MDPGPIALTSPGNKLQIQISLSLKDICTCMFTAALLTIRWKQPQCPSTDEWIKKRCEIDKQIDIGTDVDTDIYTHNRIFSQKKKKILLFTTDELDFDGIMLSKSDKEKNCIISLIYRIFKKN